MEIDCPETKPNYILSTVYWDYVSTTSKRDNFANLFLSFKEIDYSP